MRYATRICHVRPKYDRTGAPGCKLFDETVKKNPLTFSHIDRTKVTFFSPSPVFFCHALFAIFSPRKNAIFEPCGIK